MNDDQYEDHIEPSDEQIIKWATSADDRDQLKLERTLRKLRAEKRSADRRRDSAIKELELAEDRLDAFMMIGGPQKIKKIRPASRKKCDHEATAIAVTGDWHVGERVDKAATSGLNEYTPDIATKRIRKMWENMLTMIRKERTAVKIDNLVLSVLGDLISGYIHDELMESNWLSPTEEIVLARRLLREGIDFMLNHGDFKRIVIPCNYGNHGRTTAKRRVSTAYKNSYEWLLYQTLILDYEDNPVVEIYASEGNLLYIPVYKEQLRFMHGDDIRYAGGVGGPTVPLNKKLAKWDEAVVAKYTIMGHLHQLMFMPRAMINGSVIGYSPFAQTIGASFEPPQQALWLMNKEHGPTCFNRIFVT